jgi:hypothetical protein
LLEVTQDFLVRQEIVYDLREVERVFAHQVRTLPEPQHYASTADYARKVVLHGRKSNMGKVILEPVPA